MINLKCTPTQVSISTLSEYAWGRVEVLPRLKVRIVGYVNMRHEMK